MEGAGTPEDRHLGSVAYDTAHSQIRFAVVVVLGHYQKKTLLGHGCGGSARHNLEVTLYPARKIADCTVMQFDREYSIE